MIKVKIEREQETLKKITITGHAGYDDYGKDIVCAGVSAILTTSVNAALKINPNSLTYHQKRDAFQLIILNQEKITQQLMQNMIDLLTELADNYPKNIKMESEE